MHLPFCNVYFVFDCFIISFAVNFEKGEGRVDNSTALKKFESQPSRQEIVLKFRPFSETKTISKSKGNQFSRSRLDDEKENS